MSGREFTDKIMKCYDEHFEAFREEVTAMKLNPKDRGLAWAHVMSQISLNAYREAVSNGAFVEEEKARSELVIPMDLTD